MMLVFLISFSVQPAQAENEPDGSPDSPELLDEGDTKGELKTNGTDPDLGGKDMFELVLPPGHLVYYSIKKTDTSSSEISIQRFDSDLEPIQDMYLGPNSLQVPGEVFEDHIVNNGEEASVYLELSGRGNYTIHVKEFDLKDPEEPEDQYGTVFLSDRDKVNAKVYTLKYRGMEYQDTDRYVIRLEADQEVTVTIKKTDTEGGVVYAYLHKDIYSSYNTDEAVLRERGDTEQLEYSGSYYSDDEVYLDIEGEGDYELEVRVKETPDMAVPVLALTGGIICLSVVLGFSPYIIAAIALVVYLRYDKKKKERMQQEGHHGPVPPPR